MCDRPYLCDEEKCMVLELERACYNEMERESMELYFILFLKLIVFNTFIR